MTYGHSEPSFKPSRIYLGYEDLDDEIIQRIIELHEEDPKRTPLDISDALMKEDIPVTESVVAEALIRISSI